MSYPVLRIEGATVLRGSRTVVEDIDLDVICGEILCLTGPNGSGKSTLLETLAGLHAPRSGEVVVPLPDQESIPIRDSRGRRTPVPGLSIALQTDGACLDETVSERLKTASMVAGKSLTDEIIIAAMEKWALSHRCRDPSGQRSHCWPDWCFGGSAARICRTWIGPCGRFDGSRWRRNFIVDCAKNRERRTQYRFDDLSNVCQSVVDGHIITWPLRSNGTV